MPNVLALLVANERPLINIDVTLLLNLGVWVVLFFFLRATLWRPMLALIDAREAGTAGAREDASRLDTEAKSLKGSLDEQLNAARASAAKAREALRAEGVRAEADLLGKAREEVNAAVEKQRADIAAQRAKLHGEVMALVPELAQGIAARVLRREVRS
jgi:F-type H+-transporting ATPase subunit b